MSLKYTEIATDADLNSLITDLTERRVSILAMDFEGEFNLHVYGEHLALVQVFDGSHFYLVDARAVGREVLSRFLTMKNMLYMFYSRIPTVLWFIKPWE